MFLLEHAARRRRGITAAAPAILPVTTAGRHAMTISAQKRLNVEWLMSQYLPFTRGDKSYDEICKGYGRRGTTCGYLAHWLLWRLGCKNPDLVNRPEVANGFSIFNKKEERKRTNGVVMGGNLAMINEYVGTRNNPTTVTPEPGDIMIIDNLVHANANKGTDRQYLRQHVIVFLEQVFEGGRPAWRTAEAGKARGDAPNGTPEAGFGLRPILSSQGRVTLQQGPSEPEGRAVIAWLPLDSVVFFEPPMPLKYA